MRSFWHNLFQPAEKARPAQEQPQTSSPPPPPPQASAPRFELYPPPTRQWVFAEEAAGQRLRSLSSSVLAATGGPLIDRIDYLPFVTALRHDCERNKSTPAQDCCFKLETVPPPTESRLHLPAAHSAPTAGSDRASLLEPSSTHVLVVSEARGVPVDVVHGLAEAVLSAAICRRCGYRLTVDAPEGCSSHGPEGTIAWRPVLPSDEEEDGGDGSILLAPFPLADAPGTSDGSGNGEKGDQGEQQADGGVAEADGRRRRSDEEKDDRTANTGGLARRRDCLAETLGTLSVATQWSHTREELARRDRGGGGALAKGLASLLSALCRSMATLRNGQQRLFGREQLGGGFNDHSAWHDDALFFLRCLVHLARIVSNSTPAAAAWYKLVNDSTLPGTGLPDHPWSRGASDGPILPSCVAFSDYFVDPVSDTTMRNDEATVASGNRTSDRDSTIKAAQEQAVPGHENSCGEGCASRNNEASYAAMSLAADSDEWSAALVTAGLVQSLVHSLEACLELRSFFGMEAETRAVEAGAPSRHSCSAEYFVQNSTKGDGDQFCLGCWLAVAQVDVLLAIGGLLSAHPLAARDRFQLAGGALAFRQMISTPPDGRVANHDCLSRRRFKSERAEGVAGAIASAGVPFVHEHCCLVAIEVLRLHLRACAPHPVPADVAEGAERFIEALPFAMRAVWERYRVGASCPSVSSRPSSLLRRGRAHLEHGTGEGSEADSDANSFSAKRSRHSMQPRISLQLHCPAEDDLQPSGNSKVLSDGADGCYTGNNSMVDGSSTVDGRHTAARVQDPPRAPSYLLCRPRNSCDAKCSIAVSSTPTPEVTGWESNRLQEYARSVGPAAATMVNSLYRRLDSTLDETDILAPEVGAAGTAFASGNGSVDDGCRDGISGGVDEPRARSEYECAFALRILMSFHHGVLGIVADCAVQGSEFIEDVGRRGRGGVGLNVAAGDVGADSPRQVPLESVLQCAIRCFLDLVADRDSAWFSDNRRKIRENERGKDVAPPSRLANDRAVARPVGDSLDTDTVSLHPAVFVVQGQEDGVAPLTGGNAMFACPVRQLLALKFYLASMRRWPRLTIQVMRETGVWDVLFSDHFLGGCSTSVARSMESLHESVGFGTPAPQVGEYRAPEDESGGSCIENIAIGWGLVHDATLVLLEAVMVAGQLLRAQAGNTGSHSHACEAAQLEGLDRRRDVPDEPLEVGEYMKFLTAGKNGRVSAVVAVQGCAWLRDAFAREAAFRGGLSLLSPSLRGAALRLAFTLCNSAQEGGSRMSQTVAWPLLHGSLCLAVDLVSADHAGEEGILFQAAVAFFTAAEGVETRAATGLGISCIHRLTASLTSDASTHGMHVLGASWTAGSVGSSGTAASDNTDSPRIRPTLSFGDLIQLPLPQVPPPVTEILFKSALDVRIRRAAFYMAAQLGAQAGRIGLSSSEKVVRSSPASEELHRAGAAEGALQTNAGGLWAVRDTAAEVLSGLAEGYLCLCERAAAVIVAATARGEGDGGDGLVLLVDALRGASALIHAEESWLSFATCTGGTKAAFGANASTYVQKGNSGLSPLLQEAFREHWASSRLLVVLERVAGPIGVNKPTRLSARPDLMERYSEAVVSCLSLFTTLMAGNSCGKEAFGRAIANHYGGTESLGVAPTTPGTVTDKAGGAELRASRELNGQRSFAALAPLTSVVPAEPLLRALMEMLMDGDIPDGVSQRMGTDEKVGADGKGTDRDGGVGGGGFARVEEARARDNAGGQYPPEIRNPLVVPLVFRLLPEWPILEKRRAMEVFRFLLRGIGGGIANRSMCCDVQPPLIDQLLDMLPRLNEASDSDADGDELQGLAMDLIRNLGSHSITVAQLKKIFRLMQPLHAADVQSSAAGGATAPGPANLASASSSAPFQPPWLCGLLRALRGMMDDRPGPQRFFLLDGISSGLRLPPMPRWPAPRGYTFCAWVRLEATPSPRFVGGRSPTSSFSIHAPPVAGAPCLFSFCGERGQGVAACFIPLRNGRGRERAAAAAAAATTTQPPSSGASSQTSTEPRKYALELRVGAGRKKPPAVVRFPGVIITAEKWIFVAVAHSPSSWGQRGEAAVLVDNCWRVVASPFPRFRDGGVPAAAVACHCPPGRDGDVAENCGVGARLAGMPKLCSLHGQMGPVYLFAGSLSEELLRGIRQLGPDYAFSFEPPQVDSREIVLLRPRDPHLQALSEEVGAKSVFTDKTSVGGGGSSERQMETAPALAAAASAAARVDARQKLHKVALSGALTPLIFLAYNPSVWGGEYFLDNTPDHNDVKWTGSSHRGGRVIHSMSGSQSHVLIQPRHAVSSAHGGGDRGGEAKVSDSSPRERGWSGVSSEDNFFGNNEVGTFGRSSSSVHPRPRPGCMHAMRLPGTRECVTRDVRDALDCLGGVKVLLPLFAQYDHGVLRSGGRVSYQTGQLLNETVLALLAGTLRDSVPNRHFLRRHDGLSLFHHCLERVSPQHMTAGALAQACRLTDRLGSWSEDWANSAIAYLLAPSRLWVFAPPDAQLTLAGVLRGLARRCPGRMRRVVGLQRCLDALDLYYWYTPPNQDNDGVGIVPQSEKSNATGLSGVVAGEIRGAGVNDASGSKDWSYASRQWLNPSTGELLGLKASGAPLREIRARLLDAAALMACDGDGVGKADVAAVLGFLRGCRDDSSRREALRLVLRLADDPRQAARFAVASGYVATDISGGDHGDDGGPLRGRGSDSGLGRGGAAVAVFLTLVRASDPTVRLLALLALAQVLIACLRIEDGSSSSDYWPSSNERQRHDSSASEPKDVAAATSTNGSDTAYGAEATVASSTTVVVGFMGGADAKAEELAVLAGAAAVRESRTSTSANTGDAATPAQSNGEKVGGVDDVLELRGGAWEHVGLPRDRVLDVLLWAQRQVTGASGNNAGEAKSNGSSLPGSWGVSDVEPQDGPRSEAATERTVARVTLGILQGLLVGELPPGFAASVVSLSDGRGRQEQHAYTTPIVAPPRDVTIDPFFWESPVLVGHTGSGNRPPSWRQRGQGASDGSGVSNSGAGRHPGSRPPRPGRSGSRAATGAKPDDATSVTLPLLIRLPEAFPALCQQVATAPEGAAPRHAVIETLVASAHDLQNAKAILSVDSWQQYLLSVVSSAQGRQAVAAAVTTAAANSSTGGDSFSSLGEGSLRGNRASKTAKSEDGDRGHTGLEDDRTALNDACEEERLVDQTVRLICWLAMCEVRVGEPGRPGAGFAALQDTMSFLRCQAELGAMECVSVGERVLRHMMSLLKREADALESEVNGWARVSHHPSLRPRLGGGGSQGAAAVLACVWPLASLVVEFIAIPPVSNPPASAASGASTPAAAALAVIAAATDGDKDSPSRWSDDSLTCLSPMQGILQWLDTGMKLPRQTSVLPPSPSSPSAQGTAAASAAIPRLRMGSSPLSDAAATSTAGWRAWDLLDAAVDLVGPTGDTLLWDARYRHNLSVVAGVDAGILPVFGAVDPCAAKALDWGRRELYPSGREDTRLPTTPGAPRQSSGVFLGGARGSGGGGGHAWFVDAKGKGNPLADAGGVPWMLVRLLLAVFVSGGASESIGEGGAAVSNGAPRPLSRRGSNSSAASSSSHSVGSGKGGGGGGGSEPPSIALFALQRLIALLNSLEASGYKCCEFEVLHVAARVSTALRNTRLTPRSAWVLGALQLLAKCLAAQAAQIEGLLVAAEARLDAKAVETKARNRPSPSTTPVASAGESPPAPRPRLIFRRHSQKSGWWLWNLLPGAGGGPKSRRYSTPKGVLHQIAAETSSLATFPTADLTLEIIRRTLGIELPGQRGRDGHREREGRSNSKTEKEAAAAAPLTWDLMEAAFEPISEEGAGQEASGLLIRLDPGGMHAHALQVLGRVRALEGRGVEAGVRVPESIWTLTSAVMEMEARRLLALTENEQRASHRRQAQWEAVLKQLATERGPWGRGVEAADLNSVYWMLNPREDDRGRRLTLVRNPHGCRHTIASERTRGVTRSSTSSSRSLSRTSPRWGWRGTALMSSTLGGRSSSVDIDSGASAGDRSVNRTISSGHEQQDGQELVRLASRGYVRAISAQTSLWQDLCKYQHKSVKAKDSEDDDDDEESEEDEEQTDEEYQNEESRAEADGDEDGPDGPRKGRRKAEAGGGAAIRTQATFSSPADVVRPFCTTPGIVCLFGDRLVFTRSPEVCMGGKDRAAESRFGNDGGGAQGEQTMPDNYRWALRPAPSTTWPTSGLQRVLFRQHGGLRFAALELWFRGGAVVESGGSTVGAEGSSLLLGLPSEALARTLHKELKRTRPPALEPFLGRLPATVVSRSKAGTWGASGAGGVGMYNGSGGVGHGSAAGTGRAAATTATAAREAARTPLTDAWVRRRCGVTNFDYLRGLNAAAGRTTADLSRYPVFPWVLSERAWRAKELDLRDERNFRDLAWPMGAQRPEQREALHMKYEEMERSHLEMQRMGGEMADLALPPFHHGSHYSSSAYVLWYLMRLEPFTSLHIHLQDGRFDKPDRLFQSLPDAYSSCTRNPSDVKEAIPELYYLPEMLVNGTGLDLGRPQGSDKPLGDVELPPWAHGDPWECIRRHREALESEYVSLGLHKWIDLVFGYRQRPPALSRGWRGAVERCNVFFHLTYPGAVDLPRLREQDPQLYASTMKQIEEFGQTPAQLFRSPHPPRLSLARAEIVRPLASPVPGANTISLSDATSITMERDAPEPSLSTEAGAGAGERGRRRSTAGSPHGVVSYPRERVSLGAILVVCDLLPWAERLVTVDARRGIGYHGWQSYSPERSPPFRLRADTASIESSVRRHGGSSSADNGGSGGGGGNQKLSRRLGVPFAPAGAVSSRILEPPPSSGDRVGDGIGDSDGGSGRLSPLLGGLGGSYASLASMGSLPSLSQSARTAEPPQLHAKWPPPQSAFSSARSSPLARSDGWGRLQENVAGVVASTSVAAAAAEISAHSSATGERRAPSDGIAGIAQDVGGADGLGLGSHLFAVHAKRGLLFSGGYWDSSFRVTALDTGRLVVSVARHSDVVTSLSLADGGVGCRRLVTASRDTTLMVWDVEPWGEPPVSASSLLHVLYGHDTPVTCAFASASLDSVVSSGEDGTIVVHSLWGGEYIRTIIPCRVPSSSAGAPSVRGARVGGQEGEMSESEDTIISDSYKRDDESGAMASDSAATSGEESDSGGGGSGGGGGDRAIRKSTTKAPSQLTPSWPSLGWVGLSSAGYIVSYSQVDATLRSYSINGHPLGVAVVSSAAGPLRAFAFSEDGSVLLSGGDDRVVTLRWAHSLALADDGGREGCGGAVLTGAAPPLAGVPGAGAGVEKFGSAIRCLALTAGERHLLVGLEDGTMGVLALDANYLRQRLRTKLDQLGF